MINSIMPTINNIRLHVAKWRLATINPLAPADIVRELILKVDRLEKRK